LSKNWIIPFDTFSFLIEIWNRICNSQMHRTQPQNYYVETVLKDNRKEIGDEAVWTLSTAKQGNGVHQLRDDNNESFWQSDGPIPHIINIQFMKKTKVSEIGLLLDSKTDESYTPQIISIRGGIYLQNLKEIIKIELSDPIGYVIVPLKTKIDEKEEQNFVYTMNIQIAILQMFHQGKDTHIRQVKIFGVKDGNDKMSSVESGSYFSNLNQFLR